VEELEKRLENCTTATAQKQLQLDTLQQALEKLKRQVNRDHRVPTPPPFLTRGEGRLISFKVERGNYSPSPHWDRRAI
jgi:hypothetical protein